MRTYKPIPDLNPFDLARFWSKVEMKSASECWLYEGNVKRHSLERLASFIAAVVGKRLTYERLTAEVQA